MASFKKIVRRNLLTILTALAVLLGTLVGCIIRSTGTQTWSKRDIMYLQFPGDIFLRMLKALIIPLLVASVVSAIGFLDLSLSKKIAIRSILFYMTTTISAVVLGIILVLTIKPGKVDKSLFKEEFDKKVEVRRVLTQDTLMDLIRNIFPPNLIQACIAQSQLVLKPPKNASEDLPLDKYDFEENWNDTTNVLGLVTFSIIFGVAISHLGDAAKPVLHFFHSLSEIMMVVTGWVIWVSPIGIFFLVAAKVVEIESFAALVGKLGLYFATVLLGLVIHGFGTLTLMYFICTRTLPFRVVARLSAVMITAFGTASSSATMPLTIQTMDKMGLDPRVTRFVIPIGATINMDGTALYEAVAAIFIAQLRNIEMTLGKTFAVCITATAASIGAAGIPQAGLVTMVMVLDTVGLPGGDIVTIIAVDWLLDRFRTTINVMCDCLCARVVDILSEGELSGTTAQDKANAAPHEMVELRVGNNSNS